MDATFTTFMARTGFLKSHNDAPKDWEKEVRKYRSDLRENFEEAFFSLKFSDRNQTSHQKKFASVMAVRLFIFLIYYLLE